MATTANFDPEAIASIPRQLRKERGWSGAKIVGAVKLIEERLRQELGLSSGPVDQDVVRARALLADDIRTANEGTVTLGDHICGSSDEVVTRVEAGEADDTPAMRRTVAAIKLGRELESVRELDAMFEHATSARHRDQAA